MVTSACAPFYGPQRVGYRLLARASPVYGTPRLGSSCILVDAAYPVCLVDLASISIRYAHYAYQWDFHGAMKRDTHGAPAHWAFYGWGNKCFAARFYRNAGVGQVAPGGASLPALYFHIE